jgi:hypothetical protein
MKAPSLFENIDHWFAIQREKARQNGYYYVEDLGHWSERDREIYLMYYPCTNEGTKDEDTEGL